MRYFKIILSGLNKNLSKKAFLPFLTHDKNKNLNEDMLLEFPQKKKKD